MNLAQTTEPELSLEERAHIGVLLTTYYGLKLEVELLTEQLEIEKARIFAILKHDGVSKVTIDDIPLAVVGGFSSKFDKMKFVQLGGSLKMLADATEKKPKKEHLRIGGGRGDSDE